MFPTNYPYLMQNQNYAPQQQQTQSPFIPVRNELEARNYPVAYGNSVTFKDENAPYVYSKTMGFSQLDKPVFEKYRLVKEDVQEEEIPKKECGCESLKTQIACLEERINSLWSEIETMKKRKDNEYTRNGKSVQTKSNGNVVTEV